MPEVAGGLWATRWDTGEVAFYPDDHGVRARVLPGPVASPPEHARSTPRKRKSAGDPYCERCLRAKHSACPDHLDYHAEVDPLRTVG